MATVLATTQRAAGTYRSNRLAVSRIKDAQVTITLTGLSQTELQNPNIVGSFATLATNDPNGVDGWFVISGPHGWACGSPNKFTGLYTDPSITESGGEDIPGRYVAVEVTINTATRWGLDVTAV